MTARALSCRRPAGLAGGRQGSSFAKCPCDVALRIAATRVIALVVEFLAAGQSQAHLREAAAEVQLEWNQCEALSFDGPDEPTNLSLVKQQLSRTTRLVIDVSTATVWRNICIQQPELAAFYYAVGIADVRAPVAQ